MSSIRLYIVLTLLAGAVLPSQAQTCKGYAFESSESKIHTDFTSCVDLPVLDSFLHWNYHPTTATMEVAYRHTGITPATSKWVVWAINPKGKGMVGSQCLVAYRKPDGSMAAYTSPVTSYGTELEEGPLSFNVTGLTAVSQKDEIIIFATIEVPNNATSLNQVWQDGPLSKDGKPRIHSTSGPNVESKASLDILSGVSTTTSQGASDGPSLRNIHGMLNGLSWGIMMPIGAIIARHKTIFSDPAWFYLHVGCQFSAYIIGVTGWVTGLKLGSESSGVEHSAHRNVGITLFCFATLQVLALLMRPNKDHKYRSFWNIYHHSVGYSTIVLSIINIFEGFKILNPEKIWERGYLGLILALAFIAVVLEAFSWYAIYQKKKFVLDKTPKP